MCISEIKKSKISTPVFLPLFVSKVAAGFPSPADDFLDLSLDINEVLIENPSATFYVRAVGDSMEGVGIFEGDLIVIDRSKTAKHKSIVMAVVNGEFTIKRLLMQDGKISLAPENSKYKVIEIHDAMDFEVWGVASNVIHPL